MRTLLFKRIDLSIFFWLQHELVEISTYQTVEYAVGIHPLHKPQHLMELYGSIADYMNRTFPEVHFRLDVSWNYQEFEKKLYS